MLIDELIEAGKAAGKLVPARPVAPWAGERRVFLMCGPLREAIEAGRQASAERAIRRWAQLEADIGYFGEGGYVTEHRVKQLEP